MKEKIYFIGAITIFCVYYFGSFAVAFWFKTTIPLLVSNVILFPIWMNYVNKKWKEGSK